MSSTLRRFEILLPLRFNDGQPVPDDLVGETLLELRQRFGSVSAETRAIRGQWPHQEEVYRDELVRVFVTPPTRRGITPRYFGRQTPLVCSG